MEGHKLLHEAMTKEGHRLAHGTLMGRHEKHLVSE